MSYIKTVARSLFLMLLCAVPAFAASVSITPSGDSSYAVQGNGMVNVAGIQLSIGYDAASLNAPTVTQGGLVSGSMFAANTTTFPGIIKIAIVSTKVFSGNGTIATISFASKTGNGGITSATVSVIDSDGKTIAATAGFSNPSGSTSQDPLVTAGLPLTPTNPTSTTSTTSTSTTSTTSTTTGSATQSIPGTIALPTDLQQRTETAAVPPPTTSSAAAGEAQVIKASEQNLPAGKPTDEAKTEETTQYIVYNGIAERFKQYTGSKKLSDMVLLFDKKVTQSINQDPAIIINDGKSKATLTVDIPARITSSPNFAVHGGALVSFKQEKQIKGRWIVEIQPEAGPGNVTLTILAGSEQFEYPLTIIPPVKTKLTFDEKGWNSFIKETGTAQAPLHDLNSDGVRDYTDEFIFVANYLLNKAAAAKATVVPAPVPAAKPKTTTK